MENLQVSLCMISVSNGLRVNPSLRDSRSRPILIVKDHIIMYVTEANSLERLRTVRSRSSV